MGPGPAEEFKVLARVIVQGGLSQSETNGSCAGPSRAIQCCQCCQCLCLLAYHVVY